MQAQFNDYQRLSNGSQVEQEFEVVKRAYPANSSATLSIEAWAGMSFVRLQRQSEKYSAKCCVDRLHTKAGLFGLGEKSRVRPC